MAIIGGGVLIVACGIAAVVGLALLNPSHAGRVIFTTDAPTGESAGTCQFDHQVTSISAGTPVYAIYFYKARLAKETVALTIDKNGTPIVQTVLAPRETDGVDCLEDPVDLRSVGALGVGRYDFRMTIATGEVVSEGTLLIEAPHRFPVTPTGHAGTVVFTTDVLPSASAAGCELGHQVTSVTVGTPVYATYFYKALLADETVTLTVSKDGTPIAENAIAPAESNGVDCTALPVDVRDYGAIDAGTYDFKMTTATGEVVSEGALIVEAPTPPPTRRPVSPTGHAGQVVFTTDALTGASAASCKVGHQVTSVTVGTPVYATYFYKALLADETVTLTVSKDGTPIAQNAIAPAESNGVDCTAPPVKVSIYGAIGAGYYDFKMTTATGEVVSQGTLIIEAPTPSPSQSPATPS